MMKLSVALLVVLAVVLAGCTKTNPDQKPVYFDFEHVAVEA
jgi:hypothetical protein